MVKRKCSGRQKMVFEFLLKTSILGYPEPESGQNVTRLASSSALNTEYYLTKINLKNFLSTPYYVAKNLKNKYLF